MEITEEVKTYRISRRCIKNCLGLMMFTNKSYEGSKVNEPIKWEHKCNVCGNVEGYENIYPHIEYRVIGNKKEI